ncbi:metal-dependent hydrolase [Methanosarcina sp. MSH10X1]|uniref:metal-dependent hydrolase n=1 Tax=Methanosarcina sp. MSH10X1 TaxID=2507075 RepID=UPI000FFC8452|nr:metal-dependent hydrolase [Methanosarcina sp. MSH10X1]RXA19458.1 metal-dependent hydrolase [Methanosarcina sp. MSH10X1]
MVNTLSHLGVGLLLSYALGLRGRKRLVLLFLSLLPDLDYFTYSIFTLISGSVSHEARNQLFYLFGHRELTHSILFAFLVAFLIWVKTRDRRFTFGGFQALFLHILLDYTTSAKMRPFYPFSTDESALRAIYPFDPILNFLPLLPLFIVAAEFIKNRKPLSVNSRGELSIKYVNKWVTGERDSWSTGNGGLWSTKDKDTWSRKLNGLNRLYGFANRNERKLYASVILILLVWTAVFPITKIFLIRQVSDSEGTEISYRNTYPISIGKFLAAYSHSDTHYKLLEVSYWSGIEKSFYVEKVSVSGDVPDALVYAERAGKLYSTSVPRAIDYPVYSVSEENGLVTVTLSDARNPYVDKWPYFDTVYRFVFDMEGGEYEVYESHYGRAEKKLDKNYFE